MGDTRRQCEASWDAMLRNLDTLSTMCGSPATIAGQYLHAAHGNSEKAIEMMPHRQGPFWPYVREYLLEIAREDRAEMCASRTESQQ